MRNTKKWFREIDKAARDTIGKTTVKLTKKQKTSDKLKDLREKKKELQTLIQNEDDKEKRKLLIDNYKELQYKTNEQIADEKSTEITNKFQKIVTDKTWRTFWKEKKNITRNPTLESLAIKDNLGQRVYDPSKVKETMADYFEKLYKTKTFPFHPYHKTVNDNMQEYETNRDYENTRYNREPTIEELTKIIEEKKNGKSTPDIKNEMIKRLFFIVF